MVAPRARHRGTPSHRLHRRTALPPELATERLSFFGPEQSRVPVSIRCNSVLLTKDGYGSRLPTLFIQHIHLSHSLTYIHRSGCRKRQGRRVKRGQVDERYPWAGVQWSRAPASSVVYGILSIPGTLTVCTQDEAKPTFRMRRRHRPISAYHTHSGPLRTFSSTVSYSVPQQILPVLRSMATVQAKRRPSTRSAGQMQNQKKNAEVDVILPVRRFCAVSRRNQHSTPPFWSAQIKSGLWPGMARGHAYKPDVTRTILFLTRSARAREGKRAYSIRE